MNVIRCINTTATKLTFFIHCRQFQLTGTEETANPQPTISIVGIQITNNNETDLSVYIIAPTRHDQLNIPVR